MKKLNLKTFFESHWEKLLCALSLGAVVYSVIVYQNVNGPAEHLREDVVTIQKRIKQKELSTERVTIPKLTISETLQKLSGSYERYTLVSIPWTYEQDTYNIKKPIEISIQETREVDIRKLWETDNDTTISNDFNWDKSVLSGVAKSEHVKASKIKDKPWHLEITGLATNQSGGQGQPTKIILRDKTLAITLHVSVKKVTKVVLAFNTKSLQVKPSPKSINHAILNWQAAQVTPREFTSPITYRVERSDDGGKSWRMIHQTSETQFTDTDLKLSQEYYYRVTAGTVRIKE